MKTIFKFAIAAIYFTSLFLSGCKKEETNNDAAMFKSGMQDLINANQPRKLSAVISAGNGATLIGANTRFVFYPGAFINAAGNPVTGNISIEVQEFYKKSQMILGNKLPMSNQGLLDSRGEVFMNATQNGQQLRIRPGYASVQFEARAYNQPMNIFIGTTSGDLNDVSWSLNTNIAPANGFYGCSYDSINPPTYIDTAATADICDTLHTFPLDSFGWINCDYFLRSTYSPLTDLTINVPSGYDDNNTKVYVVFSTINSVAGVWYNNGAFTLSGGYQVPVGVQATIVALGYFNGGWQSSFTPITITSNHTETINFAPTTIADYVAQVNAL